MIATLAAAVGALIAGVLAIVSGLADKEFSFGNTLILSGVAGVCTGLLMFGQWVVAREIRALARGAALPNAATRHDVTPHGPGVGTQPDSPPLPKIEGAAAPGGPASPAGDRAPDTTPPRATDPARHPARTREPEAPPTRPEPEAKPRRNLLFSSSRRERERAAAAAADPALAETQPAEPVAAPPDAPTITVEPRGTFDRGWPQSERQRAESVSRAPAAPEVPPPGESAPPVTVLKSGVVDGMAYSLYSDGSIETQMPEGTMRFESIDALRTHLEQRPS